MSNYRIIHIPTGEYFEVSSNTVLTNISDIFSNKYGTFEFDLCYYIWEKLRSRSCTSKGYHCDICPWEREPHAPEIPEEYLIEKLE